MKKTTILLLLIATLGCSKENSQKFLDGLLASERGALPTEIQILGLLQLPTDGYAGITSHATLSTQDYRGSEVVIRGFGYNKNAGKSDFGALSFASIVTNPISLTNFDYITIGAAGAKEIYGTTTTVSLAGKNGLPGFSSNFYVPKMMTITSPTYSNNSSISQGTTISWESDSNNSFGVGIAIYYDPNGVENNHQNESGSTILNTVHVEDTGSYTLSASDLAGIPLNARLSIGLGRGNYQRVSMSNDYHFGLVAYSVVEHRFTKQ